MHGRRLSVAYLENLKHKAMTRLKVKESIDLLPKEFNTLLTSSSVDFEDNNDRNNYNTNAVTSSNNKLFIDDFSPVKNEKRNYKKNKKKRVSLFEDNGDVFDPLSLSNSQPQLQSRILKDFHKLYLEELELHIDQLLKNNEELQEKINLLRNVEEKNLEMTMECLKFKKFKKMSKLLTKEQKENECENQLCSSTLLSLIEMSKDYDKILLENANLKRENYNLKNLLKNSM